MPREWTPQQLALMEWLCTPGDDLMGEGKGLRQSKTLTALAGQLGVTRDALYKWQDLPGWDDALAVVARRTFRKYRPSMVKTLIAQLHKPGAAGYDRLVTAWVRYIDPALESEEAKANEEQIIPKLAANNESKEVYEARVSAKLRQLPPAEREIILNFHTALEEEQANEIFTEHAPRYNVGRLVSEDEEKQEAGINNVPNNNSVIDGIAYENKANDIQNPNNTSDSRITSRAIIPVQPPIKVQSRYNPRLRKPLRKPRN